MCERLQSLRPCDGAARPCKPYSRYGALGPGICNPSLLVLPNGTALMAARTCTWPEHVLMATAPRWEGPYRSVSAGRLFAPSPYDPSDEDPFLWQAAALVP